MLQYEKEKIEESSEKNQMPLLFEKPMPSQLMFMVKESIRIVKENHQKQEETLATLKKSMSGNTSKDLAQIEDFELGIADKIKEK